MKHSINSFLVFSLFFVSTSFSQTATAPSLGDGTSGNPYQIANLNNLYWITQNSTEWNKYYLQTAAIDASSSSGWDSGNGFSPIGNLFASFTGSYDGGGYTISGLYINRNSSDYIALFGFISDGTVKNVRLTSINITGQDYTAGLVGFSTGSGSSLIENCSDIGTVVGRTHVGGLIGSTAAGSTITGCHADVIVTSNVSGNNLGGFIGRHTQGSSISNSYSRGNVTSVNGDHVGGFAGNVSFVAPSSPTITNCYSTGNALSFNRAGGFIGSILTATVSNCYSIGTATIDGGSTVGGFVALNSSGTVSNSFWDTETSGNSTSAAGTGKTTAELKTQSTFTDAGWNFSTVWEIVSGYYPRLQTVTDGALPVELANFTATPISNFTTLNWKTAIEVNNYGFEIEKRVIESLSSGVVENKDWQKIGFVKGAGTSNSPKEYSYSDAKLTAGRYEYRLKQIDLDGSFKYLQSVEIEIAAPKEFTLFQNYTNPFNPTTTIKYDIPNVGTQHVVSLRVYDILGKEIATLVNETKEAGSYEVQFNASQLASGIYFYRIQAGSFTVVKKLMLMK